MTRPAVPALLPRLNIVMAFRCLQDAAGKTGGSTSSRLYYAAAMPATPTSRPDQATVSTVARQTRPQVAQLSSTL